MKLLSGSPRRAAIMTVMGAAALASMLTACGTSSTSTASTSGGKGCTKVGVSLPETATSARWEGQDHPLLVQYIKSAIPGATVDYSNANGSADTQQSQVESDLSKGDCILIVAAQDSTKAATIVEEAAKVGVPVIAYDRLIYSDKLPYYVSFDNVKVGQLQGQYIADHYQSYVSAGHNNLVMINGSETDNNAVLFRQGAHSAIDPLVSGGQLKLVYEKYTPGWDNPTAQTEMEAALTQTSNNVSVAYVANDGMAGTVIAALRAQKLAGKVLVTGQDATVEGFQNILLGYQTMTVYKPIAKEAQAAADIAGALSKGQSTASIATSTTKNPKGSASIPSVLETPVAVDKSNITSTVLADGFVTKAAICQGVPAGTDGIC